VQELKKMKETFIDPLLHPYSASTPASPAFDDYPMDFPRESIDHLPIAARFLSPTPFRSESPSGPSSKKDEQLNFDGEYLDSDEEEEAEDRLGKSYSQSSKAGQMSLTAKHNHPRSPYGTTATRTAVNKKTSVPFPARSHQSLPPPPRTNPMATSTQSLGRQSVHERDLPPTSSKPASTAPSRVLQKFKKGNSTPTPVAINVGISPTMLPEDLRKCLEVIENGILEGHEKLSESLRKRYDDQFPLVRSLADVFVNNVSYFLGLFLWLKLRFNVISLVTYPPRLCYLRTSSGTCPRAGRQRSVYSCCKQKAKEARR
jgi:hypothetical protein